MRKLLKLFGIIDRNVDRGGYWEGIVRWAWGWFGGAGLLSAFYASWAFLNENVPVWGLPLLFAGLLVLLLIFAYLLLLLWQKWKKFNPNLQVFGERLITFSKRFSSAVADYDRTTAHLTHEPKSRDDMHLVWMERDKAKNRRGQWIAENFGGDLLYFVNDLKRLGVNVPFFVQARLKETPQGISSFFTYCGQMIKEGRLDELREASRDDNWAASIMFNEF